MPAYNARRTIREAVDSVLAQTFRDLELVVCDDGSADGTLAALADIDDPRLRRIQLPANLGQGAARDRAIAETRAPWIAVIDADDAWEPDRLAVLMAANAGDADTMVFDDLLLCHDAPAGMVAWDVLRGQRAFGVRSAQARRVPLEDFVVAPRLLIKPLMPARLLREHGIRHSARRFGEDIEFFLRLAAAGVGLRYVPRPLYRYRITPGSATATLDSQSAMRDCLQECAGFAGFARPVRAALQHKLRALVANEALHRFGGALRAGRLGAAARELARHPSLLLQLPARGARRLAYELHRRRHAGRYRD
jgi:cellulose synthase/poly-beta-1,6-N-acetylglucosamine synthase-like glycosyltransferase